VLGLDGHATGIFQEVLDFTRELPLYEVQVTVLTAFPGTPLYAWLPAEGRILQPGRWDLCTLFDVNFQPKGMTVEELRQGIYRLAPRLYGAVGVRGVTTTRVARRLRLGRIAESGLRG